MITEVTCPVCGHHPVEVHRTVSFLVPQVTKYFCGCGCIWLDPPRLKPIENLRNVDNACVSLGVVRKMIEDSKKDVLEEISQALKRHRI